jgi:Asp-tRNA(Asn)/Glu-tRNA(Gln) amidotransferase A subunit family amidase
MMNRRKGKATKIFSLARRRLALNRVGIPRCFSGGSQLKDAACDLKLCNFGALLLLALFGSSISIGHAASLELRDTHNAFIETYEISTNSGTAIAIKDNIDIAGRVTSAGSLAMAENVARTDAFLIEKLRDAKFHIVGKTNLSEWANFRSTNSVSGWSSYGGQTTNAAGNSLNPCGSSSGSAVAVATGLVEVAIGTETNGSISCPASVNGIVGMKPTVGLVSRHGIVPIAASQDTAGPMGQDVAIVALTLAAIAGPDSNDSATALIPANFDFDFAEAAANRSLRGMRFGLLTSGSQYPEAQMLLRQIRQLVVGLGGEIVDIEDSRDYPSDESYRILLYEFSRGLEDYLASASGPRKTLSEIMAFNEQNRRSVMPYFEQEIFQQALAVKDETEKYQAALEAVDLIHQQTLMLLHNNDLDAFLGLTRGPAWQIDYVAGDDAAISTVPWFGNGQFAAITGMPHITIPAFSMNDLPVGLSVIGAPWSDKALLSYAAALESALKSQAP